MFDKRFGRRKRMFIPLFIVAALFGLSAIVMLLWNAILPALLHVNIISYWQAMGLLILCKILFGGFRMGPRGGRPSFGPHADARKERWASMSEEDKQKFKSEWKSRCRTKNDDR